MESWAFVLVAWFAVLLGMVAYSVVLFRRARVAERDAIEQRAAVDSLGRETITIRGDGVAVTLVGMPSELARAWREYEARHGRAQVPPARTSGPSDGLRA